MKNFKQFFLLVPLMVIFMLNVGLGQISITSLPYNPTTENFNSYNPNSLSNLNATIPTGWLASSSGTPAYKGQGTGTDNASGYWGYGISSDYSLGALRSTSVGNITYQVNYINNSGSTITSITLSWNYEQWRYANTSGWNCTGMGQLLGNTTLNGKDFIGTNSGTNGTVTTTAISSFTLTGLSIANGQNFAISWVTTDPYSSGNGISIDDFSISASGLPAIALSSPSQIGAGNVVQGTTNVLLSHFQAAVTVANATLNSLAFTSAGTYTSSDLTNFKLYYGTLDNFALATQLGSTITTSLGTGIHTFSSLTQIINNGNTGYFWITCDISGTATVGNAINTAANPTLTFTSGTPTGSITAGGTQTIQAIVPDIALSSPNPAVSAGNITQNTTNNVIYRFDLAVTTTNATLSGLQITTAGSYVASDLTNLKVWYSSDNTFSPESDALLSTKTTSLGAGTQVFPGWTNQVITSGTTGYIFITTDIPCSATAGSTIYVNAVTTSDISFISGNKSGTAYSGGTQTIQSATLSNVTNPAASSSNTQSVITWTNPVGCYDEIMIVAKSSSSISGTPTGNGSSYTANLTFGSGTSFGGGYVVYKGSTSGQTVIGLTNGTKYYFKFFTRNGTSWTNGIVVNTVPHNYVSGDYRTLKSGSWAATDVWETYNGTTWSSTSTEPSVTNNVIIVFGHTITINESGKNCNHLTVQISGKLYENLPTSTLRYINVYGDITCDGIIGNGFTSDGISFNIEGTTCDISGNGYFDAARIRKNDIYNATTSMTISRNINLRYGGTVLYNNAAATFNITIDNGASVDCFGDGTTSGSVAISGTSGTSASNLGSITVNNGSLYVSGTLYLTSASTTNPVTLTIGSTGEVDVNDVNCFASGSGGHILTINSGGILNFQRGGWGIYSTINNTYNFNSGSTVIFSGCDQNIVQPAIYSNLTIYCSNEGGSFQLNSNVTVNGTFSIEGGASLNAGSYALIYGESGTLCYKGTYPQTTTDNEYPTINGPKNLTIDNGYEVVTLHADRTIRGTLTLTNGALDISGRTLTFISGDEPISRTNGTITTSTATNLIFGTTGNTGGAAFFIPYGTFPWGSVINNFTINRDSSLTIRDLSVNGTLTLTKGNLDVNSFALGTSTTSTGTLICGSGFLTGTFTRWFGTIVPTSKSDAGRFPFGNGTNDRSLWIWFSGGTINSGGRIFASHIHADSSTTLEETFIDGSLTIDKYSNMYWLIQQQGFDFGSNTVSLSLLAGGIGGVNNLSKISLTRGSLAANGTFSSGSGTLNSPQANRTGLIESDLNRPEDAGMDYYLGSTSDNPMPVELSSFTSIISERNVRLNWVTANEQNNAGFEIQKQYQVSSSKYSEWEKISFVTGNGTKNTPTNYSFEDKKLNTGKYNYRLKQIDYNGNFSYFELNSEVEIGVPKKSNISQNYPNPFNPITKIDYDLPVDVYVSIKIYDITGREIKTLVNENQKAGYYTVDFNGNNLASGVYFYRIIAGDFTAVKKMVMLK